MAQPQFLDALVRHAGSSAMVDIVVRLVGCAETDSGTAALEVRAAVRRVLVPVPRRAQPTRSMLAFARAMVVGTAREPR